MAGDELQWCDENHRPTSMAVFWIVDWKKVALLGAQICMISFQTYTQIFGIHKAPIHVKRRNCVRLLPLTCIVSMCMSTL